MPPKSPINLAPLIFTKNEKVGASKHMQHRHGLAKASKVATEADVGSCKVKLPTIIAITPLPLGRRKKFWRQSFCPSLLAQIPCRGRDLSIQPPHARKLTR